MKTYQNLEILKNVSAMEIELNRKLINKAYEIFAQDRNWEDGETFNNELKIVIDSINNIISHADEIKELAEELTVNKK